MLGRGGMATVYLAQDLKHDRQVAVKVLRPELAAALGTDRFLREIRIAAQLSHPHIVPLFDSLEVEGRLLYVMPYVAGESLRDRLERERRLPVQDAIEITRQVASALAHAHGQGVVHRDIKPENILLQGGQAVVADFGIARAIDAAASGAAGKLTETGLLVGTPRYMSPEQIMGDPVGPQSDVYSLGCVLFEMLAGAPPFDGPTAQAIVARHTLEQAPSLRKLRPEVGRGLEDIVSAALAKSPDERFPSPSDFELALAGAPVRRRGSRRRFGARALAAAGLVAALAVGGWAVLDRAGRGERTTVQAADPSGVAVLYLDNLSRDSSDLYLVDGITEELIARLSQVERLGVPSRTAVRRFRGRAADDPGAIGRALGVMYLLTGSVQRSGATLRVRMELAQASGGRPVWNRTIDLPEGDILALTDEVAQQIARGVVGQLAPEDLTALTRRPTQSREAYDRYLRGNLYLTRRTSEADGRRALEEYRAALALDSLFAAAHGRMGLVYGIYASFPWIDPGPGMDSMMTLGLAAANRAIELDSSSADGWLARGFLITPAFDEPDAWRGFAVAPLLMNSGSVCRVPIADCRAEAVRSLARAVQLDPRNGEVWYQYGRSQLGTAAGDSAITRALELAPDLAQAAWILGLLSVRSGGDAARAVRFLDSAVALGRRGLNMFGIRAEARIAAGDLAGARRDVDSVSRLVTDSVSAVYHGYLEVALAAKEGDGALARRRAEALVARHPPERTTRNSIRLGLAAALTTVGETDRALDLLEQSVKPGGYVRVSPNRVWDPLRENPRFKRLQQVETAGTGG
ncbi:MAG TPA: protein kinase [Gemmatimonadales bacterium]|nr:protein kinase [Gemmatimonadales bacterium]